MSLFASKLTTHLRLLTGSALFGYLSLAALQIKVVWGSWDQWDLPLWDGATYFVYGRQAANLLIFPPLEWSPAFAGYYALFHWLFGGLGPFVVYFAHRAVTLLLVMALLYRLLRVLLPAFIAWLLVVCWIVFQVGLNNYYVVHLFVLIPLLVAYRAAHSNSAWGRNLLLIGLLTATFVRSELFLAVALVLVGRMVVDCRRRSDALDVKARLRHYAPTLIWLTVLAALIIRAGPSHIMIDRSWGAFGQHYAWGYQERHPEWIANFWFEYTEAVQRSFGSAQSILQAALNNPEEMATHFLWNLRTLPPVLLELVTPLSGTAWCLIVLVPGVIGLPGVLVKYWRKLSQKPHLRAPGNGQAMRLLGVIVITLLPVMGVIMVIRPRTIFLIQLLPPLLLAAGVGLTSLFPKVESYKRLTVLLLPLFLIGLLVLPAPFYTPVERHVMVIAEKLKDLPIHGDFGLLGPSARGFCIYSRPERCRGVEIFQVPQEVADFSDYLTQENIQVIIVNDQVANYLPPVGRSFIAQLVAQPVSIGWEAVSQVGSFKIYRHRSIGSSSPQ
ncbi:MAG: hypothetical protein HY870_24375 [Chloroflexi bacterium]|nr:hypothetical protein [Chloroflexota bacterium]